MLLPTCRHHNDRGSGPDTDITDKFETRQIWQAQINQYDIIVRAFNPFKRFSDRCNNLGRSMHFCESMTNKAWQRIIVFDHQCMKYRRLSVLG